MKKLNVATVALSAALLASTALSMPAFAADSTEKQIQMLKEQLRAMQQQLEALQTSNAAQNDAIAKETAARESAEKEAQKKILDAGGHLVFANGKTEAVPPANPKVVESGSHKFMLSSADGKWTIAPAGRIHMDFGGYLSQKPEGTSGFGVAAPAGSGRLTGGTNVRRARLGFQGKAAGDFEWSLILDAGGTNDGYPGTGTAQLINQAKISYMGIKNTAIEAGIWAQYFAMDEATSSNNIVFIERATPSVVAGSVGAGDPRVGAGFRTWDKNYWIGAYLTGSTPGDVHALNTRRFAAYERVTYQVLAQDLATIHVGVSAFQTIKVPDSGPGTAHTITLSDRPEFRIDGSQPLSTGALGTVANPVTSVNIYGVETAGTYGSFYYQGEWFWYKVKRAPGAVAAFNTRANVDFNGGYVQASYTFGGRRTYNAAEGVYGGITPVQNFSPKDGGMGAFELAARVSQLDLSDKYDPSNTAAAQPGFVNGGRQTSYTVGLNWIWNSYMLWKFNYIHTNIDKTNPAVTIAAGGLKSGLKLDAIGVRWQVSFN